MATSKLYLCILVTLALFIVVACSSAPSDSIVPFNTFLQKVAQAHYSDYAQLPTTKVQSEQAFEEMRAYILNLYNGKQAASTYVVNGRYFDCIINVSSQPNPPTPSTSSAASTPLPGQPGGSNSTSCANGTIPMERITLERLVQFPTLQAFLQKSPGGIEGLPPTKGR